MNTTTSQGTIQWTQRKTASPTKTPIVIDLIDDDEPVLVEEPLIQSNLINQCAEVELDAQKWLKTRPSPKYARRDALQQSIKHLRQAHRNNKDILELKRQEEVQTLKRYRIAQQVLNQIKLELQECQKQTKAAEMEQRDIEHWQPRLRQVAYDVDELHSSQESCPETQHYLEAPVVTPTAEELEFMDSLPWEF